MNLATAFANERMKDVGVKKVMGASRKFHRLAIFRRIARYVYRGVDYRPAAGCGFRFQPSRHDRKQLSIRPDFKLAVIIAGGNSRYGSPPLVSGYLPLGVQPLTAIKEN